MEMVFQALTVLRGVTSIYIDLDGFYRYTGPAMCKPSKAFYTIGECLDELSLNYALKAEWSNIDGKWKRNPKHAGVFPRSP